MFGRHTETQVWYVVFLPRSGNARRWWLAGLKDGFAHVVMLRGTIGGTMKVEPQAWGMTVTETALHVQDAVQCIIPHATAILQVTTDCNRVPLDFQPRFILHCVSVAKAIMALRGGRWAVTPWGLYRYLMRGINRTVRDDHVAVDVIKPFVPYMKKG